AGKYAEAVPCYERAIQLEPNYPEAHLNFSLTLLITGQFERGWSEYEWRLRCENANTPQFTRPLWDGSPLDGRTILVHHEQGIGDTLQFVRYIPMIKERGGIVILGIPELLVPLLRRVPGVDKIHVVGLLPAFDVHAPMAGLPRLFGTNLA